MSSSDDFAFGRFLVQFEARRLLIDGEPAKLGARALDVLLALIERRERVVGKNELLDLVWPDLAVEENNLSVQISALRKVLGPAAISTIPGRGYRFALAQGTVRAAESTASPAAAASGSTDGALPVFVGREDDLKALRTMVFSHRVVTIAGAGGIGKTTLARLLAHSTLGEFDDGDCLVDLAPVSDPSLAATAMAMALEVKVGNRSPVVAIGEALGTRRMLVVLDNCEHLLQSVAELVDALRAMAPDVHWLATSQEPLKLTGEHVFRLAALALPAEPTLAAARRAGAVTLFEARARASDRRFALTHENVLAAIDICRQLDGIPLAIELAAARVPLLGLEGLRSRLGERLRVLTGGARVALPRHRTLLAALDWSHGLLTPAQQTVFRRLGVFAGSFALDAAQEVAADETMDKWSVLDDLGALVDKSLVVVEPDVVGEPRYRLLETMRQYALDRLETAGDGDATRLRHLEVFVALAERAKVELFGPQQGAWMKRLDSDRENLLAAHAWCGQFAGGGERDLRLVTGLGRYWRDRALLSLGWTVLTEALNRPGAQGRDRLRCEALTQAGRLGARAGLRAQAMQAHRESIAIGREICATDLLATALTDLGVACLEQGDLADARAPMEEALSLARQLGSESDVFGSAATALGELERLEGRWTEARSLYEVSLAQARRTGHLRGILSNLHNLAMTAIVQGRVASARELVIESIECQDERVTSNVRMFPPLLCAGLAAGLGQWQRSARFEGAAIFHFAQVGWPLEPADRAFADAISARTREALGAAAYEAARASGRDLTLGEVLAEMQQWLRDEP
jgi:predicted ATPase/DNA-binding winged helix-turn-helix (wHTH) protein